MPVPPATARATKPTRQSSASMPLYPARPPLTPPRILSVRLRRSWDAAGGGGGGGGGPDGGSSPAAGRGGGGGRSGCHDEKRADPGRRGIHQGTPPSDPGSPSCSSRVITGVGPGGDGATIVTVTTPATGTPLGRDRRAAAAVRPRRGRLLAGVAAGTAAHLRQDPLIVRVAFAVLATAGIGVIAYGLLWLTMPVAAPATDPTPERWLAGPPAAAVDRPRSPRPPRRGAARPGPHGAAASSCR